MFVSMTEVTVASTSFTDIQDSIHKANIIELNERGIIGGYPDNTYRPNNTLTREQAVRLIGRYLMKDGIKSPEDFATDVRFEDVPLKSDVELLQLSAMLYEEGVFIGNNGYLDLTSQMQRQHMALALVRILNDFAQIDLVQRAEEVGYKTKFTDLKNVNSSTVQAITAIEYAGITRGEQYYPTKAITRGEFATFLNRLIKLIEQEQTEKQLHEEELAEHNEQESVETEKVDFSTVKAIQLNKGTKLYASRNLMKQSAIWNDSSTIIAATYLATDDLFVLSVAGEKYYVQSVEIIHTSSKNKATFTKIGEVRTATSYEVKNAKDGQVVLVGTRSHKIDVLGIDGNYYKVQLGEGTGYIHIADTFINTHKNVKLLSDTFVYNKTNNKVMAKLVAGTAIKVNKIENGKAYFNGGNTTFFIDSKGLVETNNTPTIIYPAIKHAHPVTVTAKVDTKIYGTDGSVLGTISAGNKVQVKGLLQGKGVIDYLGGSALVSLEQFKHTNMVTPTRNINYAEMDFYVQVLHKLYPSFTELELIGKSVEGRNIHALKVGTGKKMILMDASTHAREHMTTNVLMEMIDQYTVAYATNSNLGKYNVRSILSNVSIWFVPMVNPDGVTLVQYGPNAMKNPEQVKQINKYSSNYGRWKANARGVDINRNFDARWAGLAKGSPSWDMYRGPAPFSEPESKALGQFMLKYPFKSNFAIHSSGQVIFWGHNSENKARNTNLARLMAHTTGYALIKSSQTAPTGASASYFSKMTGLPSMTIEIAPYAGNAPVPLSRWNDVWKRMQYVGLVGAVEANSR